MGSYAADTLAQGLSEASRGKPGEGNGYVGLIWGTLPTYPPDFYLELMPAESSVETVSSLLNQFCNG